MTIWRSSSREFRESKELRREAMVVLVEPAAYGIEHDLDIFKKMITMLAAGMAREKYSGRRGDNVIAYSAAGRSAHVSLEEFSDYVSYIRTCGGGIIRRKWLAERLLSHLTQV